MSPASVGDLLEQGRIKQPGKRPGFTVISGEGGTEALVAEALDSPEALEELCAAYMPRIYNYVLKRVGAVQDAEDVTATVFEKMVVNLASFDPEKASFSTWIYRIATNCVTDYYRSRGRRRETALEDATMPDAWESGFDRRDLYLGLLDLMRRLPPKYREALALRYFANMRVQEVAETLGITESAASKRVLRGLEELRRIARGGPLEELM